MCISVQSYRYVLINDLRTLETLNGCAITDAERANAFKKVRNPAWLSFGRTRIAYRRCSGRASRLHWHVQQPAAATRKVLLREDVLRCYAERRSPGPRCHQVEEMKRDLIYNPPNVESLKLDNVGRAYSKLSSRQGAGMSANAMSGAHARVAAAAALGALKFAAPPHVLLTLLCGCPEQWSAHRLGCCCRRNPRACLPATSVYRFYACLVVWQGAARCLCKACSRLTGRVTCMCDVHM